jgi:membrane protease YdiL (CAAX protease family)
MKPGLKNPLMRAVNFLLYLSFCGLVGTGALLTWKLPPGSRGGGGLRVLDMSRHEWADIHFWLGFAMVAATVAHLCLNWQWLKKIASSGHFWRLALGLLLGLVIIFGIYALPVVEVRGGGH